MFVLFFLLQFGLAESLEHGIFRMLSGVFKILSSLVILEFLMINEQ